MTDELASYLNVCAALNLAGTKASISEDTTDAPKDHRILGVVQSDCIHGFRAKLQFVHK